MDRLKEPSSWAGFAALVALFDHQLAQLVPAAIDSLGLVAGSIAAAIAVFRAERAS